jgi:hypothetical protein
VPKFFSSAQFKNGASIAFQRHGQLSLTQEKSPHCVSPHELHGRRVPRDCELRMRGPPTERLTSDGGGAMTQTGERHSGVERRAAGEGRQRGGLRMSATSEVVDQRETLMPVEFDLLHPQTITPLDSS